MGPCNVGAEPRPRLEPASLYMGAGALMQGANGQPHHQPPGASQPVQSKRCRVKLPKAVVRLQIAVLARSRQEVRQVAGALPVTVGGPGKPDDFQAVQRLQPVTALEARRRRVVVTMQ